MKTELIKIDGMSCMHCVKSVREELQKLDLNLKSVEIGSARVEYDETKVSREKINDSIKEAGFKVVL